MMKKQAFYDKAQMLYVESGLTFARITELTTVSERTLSDWKKDGNWAEKRANFIKLQNSCSASLYRMLKSMTDIVNDQMDKNEAPDMAMVSAIEKLSKSIAKIKPVEQINIEEQTLSQQEKSASNNDQDSVTRIAELIDAKFTGKM